MGVVGHRMGMGMVVVRMVVVRCMLWMLVLKESLELNNNRNIINKIWNMRIYRKIRT